MEKKLKKDFILAIVLLAILIVSNTLFPIAIENIDNGKYMYILEEIRWIIDLFYLVAIGLGILVITLLLFIMINEKPKKVNGD